METQQIIRNVQAWTEALCDPETLQVKGVLHANLGEEGRPTLDRTLPVGECCLGVALSTLGVEWEPNAGDLGWGCVVGPDAERMTHMLTNTVAAQFGIDEHQARALASLNDEGTPFEIIAEIIRAFVLAPLVRREGGVA